jgi:hypothetical protein
MLRRHLNRRGSARRSRSSTEEKTAATQRAQWVGEEALSSAFLLFSASAIAGFNPSRKGFNRGITEGQKRGGAADNQNSMGLI